MPPELSSELLEQSKVTQPAALLRQLTVDGDSLAAHPSSVTPIQIRAKQDFLMYV
ncbi:hypothetical protein Hanom_Chr13g01225681 [Helianthus anomalus]